MDEKRTVRVSKSLSRALRHDPAAIGVLLDGDGRADVDGLIAASARAGRPGPGQLRRMRGVSVRRGAGAGLVPGGLAAYRGKHF